jgi:cation transporter-like permease
LRRYEREREERRRRANAISGRIAMAAVALLLGFLAYDSVGTALEARRRGDAWIYPPAVIAGVCLAALAALAAWGVAGRRRRR